MTRHLRIHVRARDPVRLVELHRVVGGVSQDERALALRRDEDAHVSRGVPGGGQRGQLGRDGVLPIHQLDQAKVGQRPDAGGGIGKALGLDLRLTACFPVLRAHPVARVGEGGHVTLAFRHQVPADMIAVQVSHHDHVHLVRAHAIVLEVTHELAPGDVGGVGRLGTEARVDEDRPSLRADQERAEIEADLVLLGQVGFVALPAVFGDGREEITEIELEHAVRQGHDLDIAYPDDIVGHGGRSSRGRSRQGRRQGRKSSTASQIATPGGFLKYHP